MRIPSTGVAKWAAGVIEQCAASRDERINRGAMYRNLYLTGSDDGEPAVYNKTFAYIDNLSSYLYSPVELRFGIEKYGSSTSADRAKASAAASGLHRRLRQSNVDTMIEEAVIWSLVKGKSFIKLLWGAEGFEPYLVQPETIGVFREDISILDEQEAFFHSSYYTPGGFAQHVENHPDKAEILKQVGKHTHPSNEANNPDSNNMLKQVIIGGLNPFRSSGSNKTQGRGVVDWLGGPSPSLSPKVLSSLIRLDELWIKDTERGDYTTLQLAGDVLVEGKTRYRNSIADGFDPDNPKKFLDTDTFNPLTGHHPFIEFCPNKLSGYFWGRSELCNIALLQVMINKRIDGINSLLRRQENPPRLFTGGAGPTQQQYAKLNKPGGYLTDSNPQGKMQDLAPGLPEGLWESLHEMEAFYDKMAGFTPTLQGRGESGVRAGGHSESLTKNASPRFKDRALVIERSVEGLGGLALDYLKAKDGTKLTAWVMPKEESIDVSVQPDPLLAEPPVQGMKAIEFLYSHLPERCKVVVDSHSSSPAFSHETRGLLFDLFKAGAINKEQLVTHTAPPGEDTMIEDIKRIEISQQAFAEAHPELAAEQGKKKKK
jgi:hypothetical protein